MDVDSFPMKNTKTFDQSNTIGSADFAEVAVRKLPTEVVSITRASNRASSVQKNGKAIF